MENNRNCLLDNNKIYELLPENIGRDVIKINLDKGKNENARVILFVPKGGCVFPHSHASNKNKDSEVYIDLLKILKQGIKNIETPVVAGSNSPTDTLEHEIINSEEPQIILAIKKTQDKGEWDEFNADFEGYFNGLNVKVESLDKEIIRIKFNSIEGKNGTIAIYTKTNAVSFDNGDIKDFITLKSLQKPNQGKKTLLER